MSAYMFYVTYKRSREASPNDRYYVEIEGEGEQIEGLVRVALAPIASSPLTTPRSLRERYCQSLRRCCEPTLGGIVCLANSIGLFVMAKQDADEQPLLSKIGYAVGGVFLGLSASLFYQAYRRLRQAPN